MVWGTLVLLFRFAPHQVLFCPRAFLDSFFSSLLLKGVVLQASLLQKCCFLNPFFGTNAENLHIFLYVIKPLLRRISSARPTRFPCLKPSSRGRDTFQRQVGLLAALIFGTQETLQNDLASRGALCPTCWWVGVVTEKGLLGFSAVFFNRTHGELSVFRRSLLRVLRGHQAYNSPNTSKEQPTLGSWYLRKTSESPQKTQTSGYK